MFPNASEAKMIFFFALEAFLGYLDLVKKTTYLFGCLRGALDNVCKVLAGFSVSSETVSYPDWSRPNFEDTEQLYFH